MSRDFLVKFKNSNEAQNAEIQLKNICINKGLKSELFHIDRTENTLFITLAYPNYIDRNTVLIVNNKKN